MKRHLYSSEIVRRAIVTGDPVQAAFELRGSDSELSELLANSPMKYSVRVVEEKARTPNSVRLEIAVENPDQAKPESFNIYINNRLVADVTARAVKSNGDAFVQTIDVPVSGGENEIRVSGRDGHGFLTERGAFVLATKNKPDHKAHFISL